MSKPNCVRLLHAALDEADNEIIIRGSLDVATLHLLQVGDYQREVLPAVHINRLIKAYEAGGVPDIVLGMRGGSFEERDGVFRLTDQVFIIDGLQRVTAAIVKIQSNSGKTPRLGAAVYFNTTEETERTKFKILNIDRVKLSSNILLRNERENLAVIQQLFSLTTADKSFVMYDRVCWQQRQSRQNLLSALSFVKTIAILHAHVTNTGRTNSFGEVAASLQKALDLIGPAALTANVRAFFDFVDRSWGIRTVTFKEGASHMRESYLRCLGMLFSRHDDFWKGSRLAIEADLGRKIAQFPILHDPTVRSLAGAGGRALGLLFNMMVDHINSGKRTKRLRLRAEFKREVAEEEAAAATETAPNGAAPSVIA